MTTPTQPPKDDLFSFIRTLIAAALIAIVFRAFCFEPFSIPSGSMIPSLLVGDYLFVSKYSYGYSGLSLGLGWVSRMFGVSLPEGRWGGSPPKRGDVIVFKKPTDTGIDFVKRLIGLPGDRIQVKHERLYINGVMLERQLDGHYDGQGGTVEENEDPAGQEALRHASQYQEILPDGRKHFILQMPVEGELANTGVYTVPAGYYFAMGDNRDNSQDSRALTQVGFVPQENLVGRAEFIFFSLKGGVPFWQFWLWPSHIRLDRLFQAIP